MLAVLERTAVIADAGDIRRVEHHGAVLVEANRLRSRPITEQRAREADFTADPPAEVEAAGHRGRPRDRMDRKQPP